MATSRVNTGGGIYCGRACQGAAMRVPPLPHIVMADGSLGIPLTSRSGVIRAYAIVDAADAEIAIRWRWHLMTVGYVGRDEPSEPGRPKEKVYLHRAILGLSRGDRREVDHIDRDRLNCRRSNLRMPPPGGNQQNLTARPGTSVYRGVYWRKDTSKWAAYVHVQGKVVRLGCFTDELEAAVVAREARGRLMPYAID